MNFKLNLQKLKNKSLLVKLLLSFAGTSVLSVLIIAMIFSYWFSNKNISDISDMSKLVLSNFCLTVSNVFDSSSKAAYDIYSTPYVRKLISTEEVKKEDLLDALTYLNNVLVSNSNIYSIYVCDQQSILLEVGSKYDFPENFDSLSSFAMSNPVLQPIPRNIKNKNGNVLELCTFIYQDSNSSNNLESFVIINLRSKDLNKKIYSKFLNTKQDIIIAHTSGRVVMNRDMSMISTNITQQSYFRNAIKSGKEWGYFNSIYNENKSVFNYFPFGNGKYIALMVSDYNNFFEKITQLRNTIISICIIVFFIILVLSLYFSYSLYSPINNVFSNVRNLVGIMPSQKGSKSKSEI